MLTLGRQTSGLLRCCGRTDVKVVLDRGCAWMPNLMTAINILRGAIRTPDAPTGVHRTPEHRGPGVHVQPSNDRRRRSRSLAV